jgi:hypothetical protein
MLHRDGRRASGSEQREIARLGVERDGADYRHGRYHYEDLDDAVDSARCTGSRDTEGSDAGQAMKRPASAAPTPREQAVMAAHGIQFDGQGFRFGGFRHARLIDAVHQSRRSGQGCD